MKTSRESSALHRFVMEIQQHYAGRLVDVYRINRRHLLEDADQNEVEIAVLLKDGAWRQIDESRELTRLAFSVLLETEVYIRAWPVSSRGWEEPSAAAYPDLVREFKRHAEPIQEAA